MLDYGFSTNEVDKCVYSKTIGGEHIIICLYVDDMLIFGTCLDIVIETKSFLSSSFDMKDLGEANVILGLRLIREGDSITLTQDHYVEKLLRKFGHYDNTPLSTPYDPCFHLKKNKNDSVDQPMYAQIIGSLLHLMNFSRPDIAYAVGRLSRYTHSPGKDHWKEIAHLMRYLRGTINYGITYSGFPAVLEGYCDANWISDSDETKSTSGYVFTFGGGTVTWRSAKQSIIARSTMESEFVALELAGTEAEWLKNLLAGIPLGIKPTPSVSIHCDNQSAIAVAKNKTYNGKNRHVQLRHNVVKQLQKSGMISIDYVKSEMNLADPLTKPLARKLIFETSRGMGLKPIEYRK